MNRKLKIIFNKINASKDILKNNGVEKIGIFGSYARGDADSKSDIDIIVVFYKGKKTFTTFMNVCDILENSTGLKVDVLTPESISPYIKPYIDKEIVYEEL